MTNCFVFYYYRQMRQLSYQIYLYTSGILKELSDYANTMSRPRSGRDSSLHLTLSSVKALLCLFVFTMSKEFQIYGVFQSDNLEKSF